MWPVKRLGLGLRVTLSCIDSPDCSLSYTS
jgi:hypothetical protein